MFLYESQVENVINLLAKFEYIAEKTRLLMAG